MRKRTIIVIVILVPVICFVLFHVLVSMSLVIFPLPLDVLEEDYSTVFLGSKDELLRISLSPLDKYRIKLPLEDVPEHVKQGFLIYEDRFFYYHPGVNPYSLIRALITNYRSGRIVSGASTITMQIAKLMETKERTLKSKLIEILKAFQLEKKYSKKELLEIYLNMVPMGGNVEGIGAASYLYFGKPARDLSLGEGALLIGLPKSPNRYRPDRNNLHAKKQRNRVLRRIHERLSVPSELLKESMLEAIPTKRFSNPFEAPNLIIRTRSMGTKFIRRYYIDMALQKYCEELLENTIRRLKKSGCHNGAMLLVNNKTMDVLVYIGSADFGDFEHGGQINCTNIKRSPGSLLKPFLYACGVESGLITSRKLLFDIERSYDGYNPVNFGRRFIGPVTAQEALIRSLNVPAVNLEYELGKEGLASFIRRTHFVDDKRKKIDPGLSLVLGAYPMRLEEMVKLYACLANGGRLRELRFFKEGKDLVRNEGFSVLSPEACFIVSSMLSEIERPDLPQCWEFTHNRGRIAFKTGTSFGLRDAWCIGYNPDYTVGVWLGNVDCKGSSELIGIKAAAPLVVNILNYLTRYQDSWFVQPKRVKQREVCAVSGEVAGPHCEKTLLDYYIPGVSSNRKCSIHKKIYVKKSNGVEVCRYCMSEHKDSYISYIVEIWPSDVASYMRRTGKECGHIPKHNPECTAFHVQDGLKIRSPLPHGFYAFTEEVPIDKQRIVLQAESSTDSETVYWFLDDTLVGQGSPDKKFYITPQAGEHTVTVIDSRGRNDAVKFTVRKSLTQRYKFTSYFN